MNILEPGSTVASIVYSEDVVSIILAENSEEQTKTEQNQEKYPVVSSSISDELYFTEVTPEITNSVTKRLDEEDEESVQNDPLNAIAKRTPAAKEIGDTQVVSQTSDMNVTKDEFFNFSISIKCLDGDYCNNTVLTLDPYESNEYDGYNFSQKDINDAKQELNKIQGKIKEKNLKWKAELTPVFIDFIRRKNRGEIQYIEPEEDRPRRAVAKNVITQKEDNILPYFFDWRNAYGENWITSAKSQGGCNSCWVFAPIGVIEAALNIYNRWPGLNLNLSEQDVLSCSGGGSCAAGGSVNIALNYIRDTGVVDETYFPYSASDESCSNKSAGGEQYNIDGYLSVVQDLDGHVDRETALRSLLKYGPSTAQVRAYNDFFAYSSGIYEPTTSDNAGAHVINILGYNETGDYLIVKNSWGTGWGMNGFGYVKSWFVLNDTIFNILKFATGAEKLDKGVIPMNSGEPFYTTTQNPYDCGNLTENQTCDVTWQVNATGFHQSSWDFFVIIDSDGNISTSPTSVITIIGDYIPNIESIECESGIWKNCSSLLSGANLARIRVNVTDENSNIQDVKVRLKENETVITEGSATFDSGFYIFDLIDKEMNPINYKIEVDVNDETYSINGFIAFDPVVIDTTPPVIFNVQNSSITNESVVITWDTDEASNTSVNYGTTLALGIISEIDNPVTLHSRTLTGLSDNTTYYYNVTSCDSFGYCATEGPYSFTTLETIYVNQPPTLSGVPDQNIDEDITPPDNWIDLWSYANDPDNTTNELIFAITAETNSALIDCSIDSNRYIDCAVPAADQFGSSDVTVEVSDGESTDTDTFTVTVNSVQDCREICSYRRCYTHCE
jgi:C1A family cysteine protease